MNYEQELTDEEWEEAQNQAFDIEIQIWKNTSNKKEMREDALRMRTAAEYEDWETYYDIKNTYDVESWVELMQRASN